MARVMSRCDHGTHRHVAGPLPGGFVMRIRLGGVTTTTARLTAVVISTDGIVAEIEPAAAVTIAITAQVT